MNETEAQMMILGVQQGTFYAVVEAQRKAFAGELERIAKELATYASKPPSYVLLPDGYEIRWHASRNTKRSRRLERCRSDSQITHAALDRYNRDRCPRRPLSADSARFGFELCQGPNGRLTLRWKLQDRQEGRKRRTSRSWANGRRGGR